MSTSQSLEPVNVSYRAEGVRVANQLSLKRRVSWIFQARPV